MEYGKEHEAIIKASINKQPEGHMMLAVAEKGILQQEKQAWSCGTKIK